MNVGMNAFRPQQTVFPDAARIDGPITSAEVEEITRLHFERDLGTGIGISTKDVAEALRIGETEVQQLLVEIRSRNQPHAPPAFSAHAKKRRDPIFVALALAVGLSLMGLVSIVGIRLHRSPVPNHGAPFAQIARMTDASKRGFPAGTYDLVFNEEVGNHTEIKLIDHQSPRDVMRQLLDLLRKQTLKRSTPRTHVSEQDIALSNELLRHGNWDGKYSGHLQVDFFQKGRDGLNLRLAGMRIPYYHGDDAEIDKIYRDVQEGQIQMIVEKAVELARDQGSQK